MKTHAFLLPPLLVCLLSGCVSNYQPTGFAGGYDDSRLAPDLFLVTFEGSSTTSVARTKDFAMLRAAELVLDNGFTHFVITDWRSLTSNSSYAIRSQPEITTSSSGYYGGGRGDTTYSGPGMGRSHMATAVFEELTPYAPRAELLIQAFQSSPGVKNRYVYDALFLRNSLKQKYGIK